MAAKGKGGTIKYGKSSYKGARNLKASGGTTSKGVPTLKKGGRMFVKGKK